MLGELLSHVIILKLFPNFEVVSPFFNMEEKSIRKGFDLLLYEASTNNIWITEVKSGAKGRTRPLARPPARCCAWLGTILRNAWLSRSSTTGTTR